MNAHLKKLLQKSVCTNRIASARLVHYAWRHCKMLSIPNMLLVKAEQLLGYLTSSVQLVFGASWA